MSNNADLIRKVMIMNGAPDPGENSIVVRAAAKVVDMTLAASGKSETIKALRDRVIDECIEQIKPFDGPEETRRKLRALKNETG